MLDFSNSVKDGRQENGDDILISAKHISKTFPIYQHPSDRLKQFAAERLASLTKNEPKSHFESFVALSDVTLEVHRGQSVGIIGRNGSGKSTLLQIIAGTLSPTNGEININGRVAALLELGSGFNPEFTGRENVYMNGRIYGLTNAQIDQKYDDIVSFADIGDFIDQPIKTYSSGMTLRLAFSVIANVEADILIIDEALAVGDVFFTQKCMRFLNNFMESGTLLFVSHDTSAIKALCDHVIWIDKGVVISSGSPKDVTESYLEEVFASRQGEHSSKVLKKKIKQEVRRLDQRQKFINKSNLRNDIQLFEFDQNSSSFGKKYAQIINVRLCNSKEVELSWCVGFEEVALIIDAIALSKLESLIIGFYIKDSLGQTLFGDNTYITYSQNSVYAEKGELLSAKFEFQMPRMPAGDYTVSAAIATGDQDDHIQQHWIHDAMAFQSTSSSVSTGLIGIPMRKIEIIKGGD
ncbi:MAG: ABC transporter ATP-binding protein [Rhodobacteraceae bacterium]|nr:ABC transporter ATP-binding protein [Paracoccaceae bacterium]